MRTINEIIQTFFLPPSTEHTHSARDTHQTIHIFFVLHLEIICFGKSLSFHEKKNFPILIIFFQLQPYTHLLRRVSVYLTTPCRVEKIKMVAEFVNKVLK